MGKAEDKRAAIIANQAAREKADSPATFVPPLPQGPSVETSVLEAPGDLVCGLTRYEADLDAPVPIPDAVCVRVELVGGIELQRQPGSGSKSFVLKRLGPVRRTRHLQDGDPARCQPPVLPADRAIVLVSELIASALDQFAGSRLRRIPALFEGERESHSSHFKNSWPAALLRVGTIQV